jgi:hypothetical protein
MVVDAFSFFSLFNFNIQMLSPECFLIQDNSKSYEYKYFLKMGIPFALLMTILIILILYKLFTLLSPFLINMGVVKKMERNNDDKILDYMNGLEGGIVIAFLLIFLTLGLPALLTITGGFIFRL